jgi:hypothetical protein
MSMSWFRKQRESTKEIARRVAERAAQWEREQAAEHLADEMVRARAVAREQARLTIQEAEGLEAGEAGADDDSGLATQSPSPIPPTDIASSDLALLLLAGRAMADWFLEERPAGEREPWERRDRTGEEAHLVDPPPGWCLWCGQRGPDMREGARHAVGCAVGLWLMSVSHNNR